MEYQLRTAPGLNRKDITEAVLRWLRNAPAQAHTGGPHSPANPADRSVSGWVGGVMGGMAGAGVGAGAGRALGQALAHQPHGPHSYQHQPSAPPASPTGAPRPRPHAGGPAPRPAYRVVSPAHNVHSSHQMHGVGEISIGPNVFIKQLSETGHQHYHIFVLGEQQVLLVQQNGYHYQWTHIGHGWHQPFDHRLPIAHNSPGHSVFDIGSDLVQLALRWQEADVRRMSGWQKLMWAAAEGCRLESLGSAAWEQIKGMLNWESLAALVGVAGLLLIPYVGEVVLVGLMGLAIYDLLVKVSHLFKLYYQTAVNATTIGEMQQAGRLFAQAIVAGVLDVLAVVAGGGAITRLRTLRAMGRLTLRAWIEEVVQWAKQLWGRLRSGTKNLRQQLQELTEQAKRKLGGDKLEEGVMGRRAKAKGFTGVKTTKNGGPTFKDSPYLYPTRPGQRNIVKIKMQGGRSSDFKEANKAAGFPGSKPPKGYTWHHVDDYDPKTGTCTMELVRTDAHVATFPHKGSVYQYEQHTGKVYR